MENVTHHEDEKKSEEKPAKDQEQSQAQPERKEAPSINPVTGKIVEDEKK